MRKLGVDNKHRRSMLANLVIDLIMNERIETTEARAKEARRMFEKMITLGKRGTLVSRRNAAAFEVLAPRYENRNGGYTRILKLNERRGDDALMVILELV